MEYWPFWMGGLALSATTLLYWRMTGHLMGCSGSYGRLLSWKEELALAAAEERLAQNPRQAELALLEETLEELGDFLDDAGRAEIEDQIRTLKASLAEPEEVGTTFCGNPRRLPLDSHIVFVLCVVLGGFLSSLWDGSFQPRLALGEGYHAILASPYAAPSVLFLGGLLVGFGTTMAGGCTSGHGLNGCARAQPGSLVATACFFGTAILASMVLERLLA